MKTVAETVTVTGEGLTVDLILWRKFRQPMRGFIEEVLEANPGLAALGSYLPVGSRFTIPAVDTDKLKPSNVIVLWD